MSRRAPPDEPVLELEQIQGIAVPGFLKPQQTLLQVQFPADDESLAAVCALLIRWHAKHPFTHGHAALADREAHQAVRDGKRAPDDPSVTEHQPLTAIGFTSQGLLRLTPQANDVPGKAFALGLPARSGLLGDPVDDDDPGAAQNWTVGKTDDELDALIVFAGDTRELVDGPANELAQRLIHAGATCTLQIGQVRSDLPGHEHFGFNDGISQPAIRGRRSGAPGAYISKRHLPDTEPDSTRFGYPGQDLVWPGEFVLGYAASSPDPLVPGPVRPHPAWTRNGSFLVYRRLRQDVGAFWRTMDAEAQRLRKDPHFADLTAEALAAKLVGRWPSGAPLSRTPTQDDAAMGANAMANNDFRFDDDTPPRAGVTDFESAKADIVGARCPVGSHIRKVNVRDQSSDVGGASSTQSRRILRVGVAYGEPVPEADKFKIASYGKKKRVAEAQDRGILFLSIQASIEDQFEFLHRWINNPARPRGPGGHDMVAGQNAASADGVRRCQLFGTDLKTQQVSATQPFVIATGGGYFFLPSLGLLEDLLQGAQG